MPCTLLSASLPPLVCALYAGPVFLDNTPRGLSQNHPFLTMLFNLIHTEVFLLAIHIVETDRY